MTATTTKVERKTGSGGKASAGLLLAEELRTIHAGRRWRHEEKVGGPWARDTAGDSV
jgi:hypothetical protein